MNASYTTELVVELATISRVNISRKHTIHHTILYHTWGGAGIGTGGVDRSKTLIRSSGIDLDIKI